MKLFTLALITAALTAMPLSASAQTTTFTLSGTVNQVYIDPAFPLPAPFGSVAIGDPFSLAYTFNCNGVDSAPSATFGHYTGVLNSFTFTAGTASSGVTIPHATSDLQVYSGQPAGRDSYGSIMWAPSYTLYVYLQDLTGTAFNGNVPRDELPCCMDLNAFALKELIFGLTFGPDLGSEFRGTITGGTACFHPPGEPGHKSCAGDGMPLDCPCGNIGAIGHGCRNGSNPNGAELSATGNPNSQFAGGLGTDTVQFQATGMPPATTCMLIAGSASLTPPPFLGNGLRCCGGIVRRIAVHSAPSGSTTFGHPSTSEVISVLSHAPVASTMCYQVWYRDASGPCSLTSNLTNGYEIQWN